MLLVHFGDRVYRVNVILIIPSSDWVVFMVHYENIFLHRSIVAQLSHCRPFFIVGIHDSGISIPLSF